MLSREDGRCTNKPRKPRRGGGAAQGSNSSTPPRAKRGACTPRFCHMVHKAAAADGSGFRAHDGSGRGGRGMVAGATAPRAGDDMAAATGRRGSKSAMVETAGRWQRHGGEATAQRQAMASGGGGVRRWRGKRGGKRATWIMRLQRFRPPRQLRRQRRHKWESGLQQAMMATVTGMGIRPSNRQLRFGDV
jgi:hypothetical protein